MASSGIVLFIRTMVGLRVGWRLFPKRYAP